MQLQTWFTVLRMAILQHRLYSRLYSNLSNGWNLIRKINVCDYVANASVDQLTRLGDFSMGYFTSSLCVCVVVCYLPQIAPSERKSRDRKSVV